MLVNLLITDYYFDHLAKQLMSKANLLIHDNQLIHAAFIM